MRFHPLAFVALTAPLFACAPAPVAPCPTIAPAPVPMCTMPAPAPSPPTPAPWATTASAQPDPAPAPAPPSPPPEFQKAFDAAEKALAAGDLPTFDKQLAAASAATGDDPHLAFHVAYLRATRFATTADFDHAAASLLDVIPTLAKHPERADEFWAHNTMMMIREAQGDPAAALAENDQATLAAARGTWEPKDREALAFDKDRWHRAYLSRMLAESRTGSVKQALITYAQSALDDYKTRGYPDAIAVLEAYFAALDGKRDAALAAAKRVDAAKDDDEEDLYLVVVGLEAGGDHAAADAVRRIMRKPGGVGISRSIMLRWLDLDAKAMGSRGFTPRHAGAR